MDESASIYVLVQYIYRNQLIFIIESRACVYKFNLLKKYFVTCFLMELNTTLQIKDYLNQ